ncbi:MAG: Gfo/Idh/MocA family oxidoreductase [Anaerolineae bacterium]|nr:Gfo/Idh/MocA family oxidoreductase [Anaerolineae bacterium]
MLRVLLAGLGVRGWHWAQVIQGSARAELVALVDPAAAALERARAEFGPLPAFESVKAALAALDEVDALVLANPPLGRQAIVEAAIAHKLPLLIEKPLALDLAEAAGLVRMAEAGGVSLMVGLNFRYLAVTQAMMRLLADEVVGRAEFARFTYERWRDGRRAGDAASDALGAVDPPLRLNALRLWAGARSGTVSNLESVLEHVPA